MSIRKQGKDTYRIEIYLGRELDQETGKWTRKRRHLHLPRQVQGGRSRRAAPAARTRSRDVCLSHESDCRAIPRGLARRLRETEPRGHHLRRLRSLRESLPGPSHGRRASLQGRPQTIKAVYAKLREQPARGGGKLSGRTILRCIACYVRRSAMPCRTN